jgi:hypothetical protein
MQRYRVAHTATVAAGGGTLVISGEPPGGTGTVTGYGTFEALSRSEVAKLNTPRYQLAAVDTAVGVLVIGGNNTSSDTDAVELLDPSRLTTTAMPSFALTQRRANHTAALLADGRVLVAGGLERTPEMLVSTQCAYPGTGIANGGSISQRFTVPDGGGSASNGLSCRMEAASGPLSRGHR